MRNTHAKCKPQTKGTVLSVCKPKGRFFRSVRLYLTDIMIDICYNWRKFWQKNGERGLMRLVASDESDLSDLSDTNLLTRQLANLLTR